MINFSICLSDIPATKRTQAKNGKWYANFTIVPMKETDQYGKTHTVYISQSKDEREAKENKLYIGKGTEVVFEGVKPTPDATPKPNITDVQVVTDDNGLPF